jgi:drug/metabolite transporter (DMT)-like permease
LDRQTNGKALTVGASIIWGTSFVAVSVGLQYSNPYALVFERFFVAALAVLALGIFSRTARVWTELRRPEIWALATVWGAGFLLQFAGQSISGASASALLSNLFVVFVPVAAYFVLRERLTLASKVAVAVSVVGILLVLPSGLDFTGTTVGDLLLVGAALGNTSFIVLGKKYGIASLASSFALIVSIAVITAPLAVLAGGTSLGSLVAPADWESVIWLGVPCTVLAVSMYTRGLSSIRASQSATLLLMEIIVGVALSVALLRDALSLTQVLGALTIFIAILLSSKQ